MDRTDSPFLFVQHLQGTDNQKSILLNYTYRYENEVVYICNRCICMSISNKHLEMVYTNTFCSYLNL